MAYLLKDIKSNTKAQMVYGTKGQRVEIIDIRLPAVIVEGPTKFRFSVNIKDIQI
jgi:hypothetical protein